jgi:hypothetical protein
MVLPRRPAGTGNLDEQALAALVTRNGLIGVAPVWAIRGRGRGPASDQPPTALTAADP